MLFFDFACEVIYSLSAGIPVRSCGKISGVWLVLRPLPRTTLTINQQRSGGTRPQLGRIPGPAPAQQDLLWFEDSYAIEPIWRIYARVLYP